MIKAPPKSPATTTAGTPRCVRHTGHPAGWQCTRCGKTFCDDCMALADGRSSHDSCPECREFCRSLANKGPAKPQSFGELLADAFAYPFRGAGIALLVIGVLFFVIVDLLSFAPFFVGLFWWIFGLGFFAAFSFNIIASSAKGNKELPGFPEYTGFSESILSPFLQMLSTALFCYGPAGGLLFWMGPTPQGLVAFALAAIAGSFAFPMALLCVALYGSADALSLNGLVSGIRAAPAPYFGVCVVLGALIGLAPVIQKCISHLAVDWTTSLLLHLVVRLVGLIAVSIKLRLIGLIYYAYQDRFDWFRR